MHEIAKELIRQYIGKQTIWGSTIPGCLLWIDDVAFIHHDKETLQKVLDITDNAAKRYHIQFGNEKEPNHNHMNNAITIQSKNNPPGQHSNLEIAWYGYQ
jgi:hypothetical protein